MRTFTLAPVLRPPATGQVSTGVTGRRHDAPRWTPGRKPAVVRDEQVSAGRTGARELDRVWRADTPVGANPGIGARGILPERQDDRRRRDGTPVAGGKVLVPRLEGLDQNLADRQRRGVELVAPFQHSLAQRDDAIGVLAASFEQIDEEVGIPKDAAHSQLERKRPT
jgi:hypothetical protein